MNYGWFSITSSTLTHHGLHIQKLLKMCTKFSIRIYSSFCTGKTIIWVKNMTFNFYWPLKLLRDFNHRIFSKINKKLFAPNHFTPLPINAQFHADFTNKDNFICSSFIINYGRIAIMTETLLEQGSNIQILYFKRYGRLSARNDRWKVKI